MSALSLRHASILLVIAALAACSTVPLPPPPARAPVPSEPSRPTQPELRSYFSLQPPELRQQIVISALGLLDTGYRFGGRNPEAGLDCSGMVSYLVETVSGHKLPHNAAQIASMTRPVERHELEAGDLVFFNTDGRPHSHMGIYLGNQKFIHAPSTRGRVRVERLDNLYYFNRFTGARTLVARDSPG